MNPIYLLVEVLYKIFLYMKLPQNSELTCLSVLFIMDEPVQSKAKSHSMNHFPGQKFINRLC